MENPEQTLYQRRILFIAAGIALVFLLLFARLWYIQITRGEYYRDQAERNRLRIIELPAPRGLFLDRNGKLLVDNEVSFSLILRREFMKDRDQLLRILDRYFNLERAHVEKKLDEYRYIATVFPITLKNHLCFAEIAYVEAHKERFPELSLEWVPTRRYVCGEMASHLIGYVGEVTADELKQPAFSGVSPGDFVGKSGLERRYNGRLIGRKGQQKVFINSLGEVTRVVDNIPAQKGRDLLLTIDKDIQITAEEVMKDQKGALVAMNPRTGEIYCLVSKPEFDPNLFMGHLSPAKWKEFTDNPDHPLQNKVIQGAFAPGSVFKILVASAALGEGLIDTQTSFSCTGETIMLGRTVHCWETKGHGAVQLAEAIINSCNIYFYNLGLRVGVDKINMWALRMGMGLKTGIDLPGERAGLIPSSAWKKRTTGLPWYQGETISVAIGQGAVSVTPIQVARFMSAIALNRVPPVPHLVANDGEYPRAGLSTGPLLPPEMHDIIVSGMQNVVEQGTGTNARLEGIHVAGKTGTAQIINTETAEKMQNYQDEFKENSWFACFAPVENPQIAIAVLVEHGGHGGTTAAPIAAGIMEKFFTLYPEAKTGEVPLGRK